MINLNYGILLKNMDTNSIITDPMAAMSAKELQLVTVSWSSPDTLLENNSAVVKGNALAVLEVLKNIFNTAHPACSFFSIHPSMSILPMMRWYQLRCGDKDTALWSKVLYTYDICAMFYGAMILTFQLRTSFDVKKASEILTGNYTDDIGLATMRVVSMLQK